MSKEILNIVDAQGNVIGEATREKIHKEGLLHRECGIWFHTPAKEIIFQIRGPNKSDPGTLGATVGGHVAAGKDFLAAAIQEAHEETGLVLSADDLCFDAFHRNESSHNNYIEAIYSYLYKGKMEDLIVEAGEGSGFKKTPIQQLLTLGMEEAKAYTRSLPRYLPLFEKILKGGI